MWYLLHCKTDSFICCFVIGCNCSSVRSSPVNLFLSINISRSEKKDSLLESNGYGCIGDPGKKRNINNPTTMVNNPSRRNIHLHSVMFLFPANIRIAEQSIGLKAYPPNIPKK